MKIKGHNLRDVIASIDRQYGISMLENLFSVNWFNPFATLWINFRSFPLKQAIKLPIWCYGRPRFYGLSGIMQIDAHVKTGMIRYNQTRSGSPNFQGLHTELTNEGKIIFHGKGVIGTGNKIFVAQRACLDIGANFKIADQCNIGCFTNIIIGEQSRITHRCQILDSNYHLVANYTKGIVPYLKRPIIMGTGCWICNSSTVTGGTILPDYTIVASNSLIGKDFSSIESGSMIGGIPAKYITSGLRRVENKDMETAIYNFYFQNPDGKYVIPEEFTKEFCSRIL